MIEVNPVFAETDRVARAAWGLRCDGADRARALRLSDRRFLSHDPISRASPTMAQCAAAREQASGEERPAPMGELWDAYGLPTVILIAEILAIIVPLLLAVAYLTYAERKVMAAVHLRWAERGRPVWAVPASGRRAQAVPEGDVIPSGANRMVFIAAPIITFVLASSPGR